MGATVYSNSEGKEKYLETNIPQGLGFMASVQ